MTEKRLFVQDIERKYLCEADGCTIEREWGSTPSGNPLLGRWVYRNKEGRVLDYSQYRNDIFERYNIKPKEWWNK